MLTKVHTKRVYFVWVICGVSSQNIEIVGELSILHKYLHI